MGEKLTTNNHFSKPKLNGTSHIFFWQFFVTYWIPEVTCLLQTVTECIWFSFHWALQTLHFSQVQKNIVQWVFWLRKIDKIISYKYFQTRKHNNGLYVFRYYCFKWRCRCWAPPCTAPNIVDNEFAVVWYFFLCISVKIYSYSTLCLMTPYFKTKLVKIWGTEMAAKNIRLGRELCD